MHNTVNPHTGKTQTMVFSDNYNGRDKDRLSLAEKPKGMEIICCERGLLDVLVRASKTGKVVGVCSECWKSEQTYEKAAKEAKEKRNEIEGSGIESSMFSRAGENAEWDEDGVEQ